MIKFRRLWGISAVLGGAALLGGCVAYPAGSYGYSDPYYVDQNPVVVQPNVYIDGSYYSRPRYPAPYYYGRPGYYPHPGYPRPGWGGGRPTAVVPPAPPPRGMGPTTGGVAGTIVPVPPGRSRQEINRMMTSPDSRGQTPP
ncbi:hypothetical protein [Variovorax sp. JS1663]|uniref:hypothetical protein n=1 Tax=Variovorax sp. JS1663 TaxID=1851577 RepID=UPI000B343A35|nr:hypothetical protein [Variovorax sp. JS1663]OUM02899.1 hypothetical protein A8M77_08120 [Variovorax sp. JS1663]